MTWAFVRKFWPFGVIIALAFVVLFMRNTITDRTAERDRATARVADVTEANASLKTTIDTLAKARVDNDAIAAAVAAKIGRSETRLIEYRTTIEKAKANEPGVRDWGAVAVPSSVRRALRAGEGDAAPR